MKIDLTNVEAWKGGGILPPGTYSVEITSAEEKISGGGNPQVEVELRAIGGECDGGTIRDWITITEAAFGRIRQFLEAVRYDIPAGEFEMPVSNLVGRQCQIIVREEPYDGNMKSKVKAYEPLSSDVTARPRVGAGAASVKDDSLPF
jgi:hypothetical protein